MGIDIASPDIDKGTEKQGPYNQLAKYLEVKGTVVERELGDKKREILEFSRKGVLKTHLSLPIIGDTDYKAITFKISRDADEPNPDIIINITDPAAVEKAEKKDLNYTPTTITIPVPQANVATAVIEHPNDMWRWLGLNIKLWINDSNKDDSFVTKSKEEAEKVASSFTNLYSPYGDDEQDADTYLDFDRVVEDPKISRRSFFRLVRAGSTIVAIDSVLAHIPGGPSGTKGFWEQLETLTIGVPPAEWIKYMEDNMDVILNSPSMGITEVSFGTRKFGTLEWDTPRLKILYATSADLPENFHQGKKINIALVDQPRYLLDNIKAVATKGGVSTPGGYCSCYNPDNQLVVLNKIAMGQTIFEAGLARGLIVHEFTHRITTPNIHQYVDSILAPIGITQAEQLKDIFKIPVVAHAVTFGMLGHQGYGATNFMEFFSVAAEYYVKGKGAFMRSYLFFVGQDNAEKLYEGMKTKIFEGKEY